MITITFTNFFYYWYVDHLDLHVLTHSCPSRRSSYLRAGFWLDAPEDRLIARVESRRGDASDASAEIVRRQLGYALGAVDWVRIDASGRPEASASMIRDALHQIGRAHV